MLRVDRVFYKLQSLCKVMFLGADVTHAPPSDMGEKPSIAAVVASMDQKASQYQTKISVQPRVQNAQAVEMILELEEIVRSLLKKFRKSTKLVVLVQFIFVAQNGSFEF